MQAIFFSKREYEKLEPLDLSRNILNTEGELRIYPFKSRWEKKDKVIKRLYNFGGEFFGNKLSTINSLINYQEEIGNEQLVLPERLVVIDKEVCAFSMPLIPNYNFADILKNQTINPKTIYSYFKQINDILARMEVLRTRRGVRNFYLNDIHESNFILNMGTNKIMATDLDSCRIDDNKPFVSKSLSPLSPIVELPKKYKPFNEPTFGIVIPDANSDIYCFNIMLLNYLYKGNIKELTMAEFFNYLQYLKDIGFDKRILDNFSKLYSYSNNEFLNDLIDLLPANIGRASKEAYRLARKM